MSLILNDLEGNLTVNWYDGTGDVIKKVHNVKEVYQNDHGYVIYYTSKRISGETERALFLPSTVFMEVVK